MQTNIAKEIQQMTKISLKQEDFIGKGAYANVYRYKIDNVVLAVKCFLDESKALEEKAILQKIQGLVYDWPGILQYQGIKQLDIDIIGEFCQNYAGYTIFFQECLSDIYDFQKILGIVNTLQTKQVFHFLSSMSLSLLCMHLNNCFHGDIKPSNILVNQDNQQQNIYYNLTCDGDGKINKELKQLDIKTLALRITPFYFAPELWYIFNKEEQLTLAADINALGIVSLELFVGIEAIRKLNSACLNVHQYQYELANIKNLLTQLPDFQENKELLEILLKMVNFKAEKRPKIIEVCQVLINAKTFQMEAFQNTNLQPLIIELINSFNQLKPNFNNCISNLESDILKNFFYSTIILTLFEEQNISFQRIHAQFNIQNKKFNCEAFHQDCDYKGSTLVIMHSNSEPNSFFGGMAAPSWNQDEEDIADPVGECSWLFKIEVGENMLHLHQWKCIKENLAIFGHPDCGPYFGEEG